MKKTIIAVITTLICVGAFAQTPPINPESVSVNSEYTFDTSDGNAGEVQITNGSGNMSFDSLSFANLKGKDSVLTISDTVSTLATQYDLTQVGVTIPENLIPYGDPSSELTTESAFSYNPSNNTLSADNFNGSEIDLTSDMTVANIFSTNPANPKTLTTGTALNTGINLLMTGTGSANPGDIRFRDATTNLLDYDSSEDEWVFNGKKASYFSGIQIDSDNISTFIRSYDNTSYSEITALIGGTTSGGLIESAGRKHLVVGIRSNDDTDGFHVISTSEAYDAEVNGTAAPYDTRVASFFSDGDVQIPNGNVVIDSGTVTINDYTLPSEGGAEGQAMVMDGSGNVVFDSLLAYSGTYTPTVHFHSANTSSAAVNGTTRYTRIADQVDVYISITVNVTSISQVDIIVSLPVASSVVVETDVLGMGVINAGESVGIFTQNLTNSGAVFDYIPVSTGFQTIRGSFHYVIK